MAAITRQPPMIRQPKDYKAYDAKSPTLSPVAGAQDSIKIMGDSVFIRVNSSYDAKSSSPTLTAKGAPDEVPALSESLHPEFAKKLAALGIAKGAIANYGDMMVGFIDQHNQGYNYFARQYNLPPKEDVLVVTQEANIQGTTDFIAKTKKDGLEVARGSSEENVEAEVLYNLKNMIPGIQSSELKPDAENEMARKDKEIATTLASLGIFGDAKARLAAQKAPEAVSAADLTESEKIKLETKKAKEEVQAKLKDLGISDTKIISNGRTMIDFINLRLTNSTDHHSRRYKFVSLPPQIEDPYNYFADRFNLPKKEDAFIVTEEANAIGTKDFVAKTKNGLEIARGSSQENVYVEALYNLKNIIEIVRPKLAFES